MSKPTIKERTQEEINESYQNYNRVINESRKTLKMSEDTKEKLAEDDLFFEVDRRMNRDGDYVSSQASKPEASRARYVSNCFALLDPRLINGTISLKKAECYQVETHYQIKDNFSSENDRHGHMSGALTDYYSDSRMSVKKLSPEEVLELFTSTEVPTPREPERGFLTKLLDLLSGIFPSLRSEEMKEYDRRKEVTRARRCRMFEEITGCKTGLDYDKKLADREYGDQYISTGLRPEETGEEKQAEPQITETPARKRPSTKDEMILKSALAVVDALKTNSTDVNLKMGALAVQKYLNDGGMEKEQGKLLATALAGSYESIKGGRLRADDVEQSCAELLREVGSKAVGQRSANSMNSLIDSMAKELLLKKTDEQKVRSETNVNPVSRSSADLQDRSFEK